MNGRGEFTGTVTGTLNNPMLKGAFKGRDIQYAGRTIGSAEGALSFDNGYLTVSDTRLTLYEGSLNVDGTLKVSRTTEAAQPDIKAVIGFENYALETLAHLVKRDLPVEGLLSGKIMIEGSYAMPEGEAFLAVEKGGFYRIPFKNLEARVLFAPPQINLTELRFETANGSLTAAGTLDSREKSMAFTCRGEGLDLASVPFLKSRRCEGIGSFSASIQGSPENPDIRIDPFQIEAFSIAGTSLPRLEGTADMNGESGGFRVQYEDGSLVCSGSFEPRGDLPVEGEILFLNTDFVPLLKAFTGFSEIEEQLKGKMNFRLSALKPDTFESTIQLEKLSTSFGGYRIENHAPIKLSLKNKKLSLDHMTFTGENSLFEIAGTVDLSEKKRLDLQIDGEINLVLVKFFAPQMTARGRLSLAAELTGSTEDPIFTGAGEIKEGYLSIPDFPYPMKNIRAALKLSSRKVEILSCLGELGGGTVNVTGDFYLLESGAPGYALDIDCADVQMKYPAGVASRFDANVQHPGTR